MFEIFNNDSDKNYKPSKVEVSGGGKYSSKLEPGNYAFTLQSIEEAKMKDNGLVYGLNFVSEEGVTHTEALLTKDGLEITSKDGRSWKRERLLDLLGHFDISTASFAKAIKSFEKLGPTLTLKVTEGSNGRNNAALYPSDILEPDTV